MRSYWRANPTIRPTSPDALVAPMAAYSEDTYDMLLDSGTVVAWNGGKPYWCKDTEYTCDGIDNTIFPEGQIPLKKVIVSVDGIDSYGPGKYKNCSLIAAMWYAQAHKSNMVKGAPIGRLTLKISHYGQWKAFCNGSLKSYPHQHTIAFCKRIDNVNYPKLEESVYNRFTPDVGEQFLHLGYELLNRNRIIPGVN